MLEELKFSWSGNAKGKHCVLVDDLIQSGGTLIECGKVHNQNVDLETFDCFLQALLELGAVSVSAFCTHAVSSSS